MDRQKLIKETLDDLSKAQINLGSDTARQTMVRLINAVLSSEEVIQTNYTVNDKVKVIGTLQTRAGEWDGAWTQDMYHTLSLNKNRGESPTLVVAEDAGLKRGVLCHDGNYWPHRVLIKV